MTDSTFDFAAYKQAFENQDLDAWLAFYADAAEWVEYRHNAPPRAPNRMVGKAQIGDFLRRVKASNIGLSISDEVIGDGRAAFRVTAALANDKCVIENVIIHIERGKITRQTDVEAWD
jgi:ketosteroid isomerase-like protein